MLLGGRAGRLDGGEGFEDLVRVRGPSGDRPGVAFLKLYHRTLQVELGAALEYVSYGLVAVPFSLRSTATRSASRMASG